MTARAQHHGRTRRRRRWWRSRLLLAGLAGAALLALGVLGQLAPLERVVEWLDSLGGWGPVALAATFVGTSLALVPGMLLNVAAGALFGIAIGSVASLVGSTLGALAAFLLARTALRGRVERWMAKEEHVRALDTAVSRSGFKVVLASRLSPAIPFNTLNYAFGLTRVSFRDYVLGSVLGMIPIRIAYASLGAGVGEVAGLRGSLLDHTPLEWVLLVAGFAVSLAFLWWLTRKTKEAMDLPHAGGGR